MIELANVFLVFAVALAAGVAIGMLGAAFWIGDGRD